MSGNHRIASEAVGAVDHIVARTQVGCSLQRVAIASVDVAKSHRGCAEVGLELAIGCGDAQSLGGKEQNRVRMLVDSAHRVFAPIEEREVPLGGASLCQLSNGGRRFQAGGHAKSFGHGYLGTSRRRPSFPRPTLPRR